MARNHSKFTQNDLANIGVIGSLMLHMIVWIALLYHQGFRIPEKEKHIEITVIEKPPPKSNVLPPPPPPPQEMPKKETQVVEQDDKPTPPQKSNSEAKYLGARNQKVAKETHAKKAGKLKNAEKKKEEKVEVAQSDVKEEAAESQSEDVLKDVAAGMQTMLNTQQFAYYNYYKTIKEKVTKTWEPLVGQKVKLYSNEARDVAQAHEHKTRMLIILDGSGEISHIEVVGGSGIKDADNAVIEAFKKASPFGTPPKGLISANGEVRLRWDFVVEQD